MHFHEYNSSPLKPCLLIVFFFLGFKRGRVIQQSSFSNCGFPQIVLLLDFVMDYAGVMARMGRIEPTKWYFCEGTMATMLGFVLEIEGQESKPDLVGFRTFVKKLKLGTALCTGEGMSEIGKLDLRDEMVPNHVGIHFFDHGRGKKRWFYKVTVSSILIGMYMFDLITFYVQI